MSLDQYQNFALEAFNARHHVAIIGAAGTGKSHLLLKIMQRASEKYGSHRCVACAWTNNAARNINGTTLHKLFSAKINWEWSEEGLWSHVQQNRKVLASLLDLKVIIIDEIFTIKSNVFDAIDFVLRRLVKVSWHAGLALGGRLLVVSGDPFQLEPIFPKHEMRASTVIDSSPWYHCFGNDASGIIVNLPANHRQASDPAFFSVLSRLRVGEQTPQDLKTLNNTSQSFETAPSTHTRLVLTHREAAKINEEALNNISLENPTVSNAFDSVLTTSESEQREAVERLDQAAIQKVLTKVGSRVLLTRKYEKLFPGTDLLVTDIRPHLLNCGSHETHELVCVTYSPRQDSDLRREGEHITLVPMRTPIHSISGQLLAYREQLPVVPAYAITVHRSQSLSIRNVAIDFGGEVNYRWNPYGKVYVALSRCTSLRGLWVRGLRQDHISISPSARRLMEQIEVLKHETPGRIICKSLIQEPLFHRGVLSTKNPSNVTSRQISNATDSPVTKRLRVERENVAYPYLADTLYQR